VPARRVKERHYCVDCVPLGGPFDVEIVVASTTALIGLLLVLIGNQVLGLVLVAVAAVRAVVRVAIGYQRRRAERKRSRALFLDPNVVKLGIVETLRGRAEVDAESRYTTHVDEVSGEIEVKAIWARARTVEVSKYRSRRRLGPTEDLPVVSGALVVHGPARICVRDVGPDELVHPAAILLRSRTSEHAVLQSSEGRGDPRWTVTVSYDIQPPETGWSMPVWITPTIAPGSDRRALDLEVQWRTFDPCDIRLDAEAAPHAKEIKELKIFVPADWGEIERFSSEAEQITVSEPVDGRRWIEWRKPEGIKPSTMGRTRLSTSFQQRIDPETRLAGELTMVFEKALSGADGVQVHATGGAARQDVPRCTVRTHVVLEFELSLAGVRYQDIRAVPDPRRDSGEGRREHQTFSGVVPDHHTVAQLTDILSHEDYYVKRVVENPPQPGRDAGVVNRFWDIAGRRYKGVHPVDFHLIVTGEEVEPGAVGQSSATVRLTVRGTYATPGMEEQIVKEQELLWDRIVSCVAPTEAGADGGVPRGADEPIDAANAELARLRNVALSLRERICSAQRRGQVPKRLAAELASRIDEDFGLDRAFRYDGRR
jgi:hypothetical protein